MLNLPHIEQQRRDRALCTRIGYLSCVFILGFTGISARLYWLQVRQHDTLTKAAAKLRQDKIPLPAKRGSLWDANGELLAQDRTVYELHANIKHLNDPLHVRTRLASLRGMSVIELTREMSEAEIIASYRDHIVQTLAQKMNLSVAEVTEKLQAKAVIKSKDNDPAKTKLVDVVEPSLLKDLEKEEAETWTQVLKDQKITGVYLRSSVKRFYPAGDRLAHVLGMVTFDKKGYEGVEQLIDQHLTGVDGWEKIERDAKRMNILPGYDGAIQEPRHGCHAILTIDMTLQHQLEEKLLAAYNIHHPRKIMGVIIEPATGNILAMASIPLYQELYEGKGSERRKTDGVERRNMAVTDLYEPGSTMKIITIAAALDSGSVSFDQAMNCHGGYYTEPENDVTLRDDENENFTHLTVKNVLVHSSNVGAYMIAKALGPTRFHSYIGRFGFGHVTSLGLPRESSGIVFPLEKWKGPALSRIAMGYQVSVTPLQMAMAVGAIANKGKLMQPRLVSRIITPDGLNESVLPPVVVAQACSAATAQKMTEAMTAVVKEGTGKQAAIEGTIVAGKTGTAQRYDAEAKGKQDKYPPGHYVVSFVGFAPAEAPKVACVIVLDDPKASDPSMLYGGKLAAPLFSDVVQTTLTHLDAAPDRPVKLGMVVK